MTGHLLGAAGAVEAILSILAIRDRFAPATINIDNLDPEIPLDVVRRRAPQLRDGDIAVLNNSSVSGATTWLCCCGLPELRARR